MGIDWNGVSAIATVAAVVVALYFARSESRRRSREDCERARGVALLFINPFRDWMNRLRRYLKDVELRRFQAIDEGFDDEEENVMSPPQMIGSLLDRVHELGDAALPVCATVHSALQARRMQWRVRDALLGNNNDAEEDESTLRDFHAALQNAVANADKAIQLMEKALSK